MKRDRVWGTNDLMVMAAFRYCLGRMTYIVSDCCDWLIAQWPVIKQSAKDIIKKELEEVFKEDDALRANPQSGYSYKPLGHNCDREQWERVRALWREGE